MASISKEEAIVINKMFSWCECDDELSDIKKIIIDVKRGKGLHNEIAKCNGDLYSLKLTISDHTNLNHKSSSELAMALWRLVKSVSDRERMSRSGILCATWVHEDFLCYHSGHAKFNGIKFNLEKGIKTGIFIRIYPQQLVGCGCWLRPVMPF